MFRDRLGNQLEDNDVVCVALGSGQLAEGRIAKTGGIVAAQNQNPFVVVVLQLVMPADQAGTVPGLFKLAMPKAGLEG